MTRVVSVGRSKGLLLASALGTALLASMLTGCPGTLDPSQFPPTAGGGAGTTGAAGTTGMAGTSGAAGACDATPIFAAHNCILMGACHDAAGSAANFKMTPAGWEKNLVGVMPPGGGAVSKSMCNTAGMPYLVKGSNPATGIFMNKLMSKTPVCGMQMPNLPPLLDSTEMACVQSWANALVAATP